METAHIKKAYRGTTVLWEEPMVATMEDVLNEQEIAHIMALAKGRIERARVSLDSDYGYTDGRTGGNCWLAYADDPVVATVGERIAQIVGIPLSHAESMQVIHYGPHQEYKAHFDAYDLRTPRGQRSCRLGGQRLVTALVYLNHVERGGGTAFPTIGIHVDAHPGRMVVFNNVGDDISRPDPQSLHAGCPVEAGEKWAFNLWFHARPYTEVQDFSDVTQQQPVEKERPVVGIRLQANRAVTILQRAISKLSSECSKTNGSVLFTYWDTYHESRPPAPGLPAGCRTLELIDRPLTNQIANKAKLASQPEQAVTDPLLDARRKLFCRAYLLLWNGKTYIFKDGLVFIHAQPYTADTAHFEVQSGSVGSDNGHFEGTVVPGSSHPAFIRTYKTMLQLIAHLQSVLQLCLQATTRERYAILGVDYIPDKQGKLWLQAINNAPNFIHNDLVNRIVNAPFFEAIIRLMLGLPEHRLQTSD